METSLYSIDEFNDAFVKTTLDEVYDALTEKGYNAINQLTGYIMSGDPGYISSYRDARKKIVGVDRSIIIEFLLRKSLGDKDEVSRS